METILVFAALGLMSLSGAYAINRARQYAEGTDVRRESLESLAGLCESHGLTVEEKHRIKAVVEFRLQRL